jgi:hypothetical protein
MKKHAPIFIGILICIFVAGLSIFWAFELMDSLYSYRSPLRNTPPIAGEATGRLGTRSLVMVLVDGLRYDTSMNSAVMPYLNQLRSRGASAKMHSKPPSYSQAGYTVLLTGTWPDLNDGPTINREYADIPSLTQDNIFADAHQSGLQTAISASNWFEKLVPQKDVTTSFYTAGEDRVADGEVLDAALVWLQEGKYQLVLIHLDQMDYAGHHSGGPISENWNAAATTVDGLIKVIALNMNLNMDTLLIVSDHGHINYGGHGGQDAITLLEPFVLVGKGVIPGNYGDVQMVDVAPTIAAILGTSLPATSQGNPKIGMLDITLQQVDRIKEALSLQQAQLVQAYQDAIGDQVTVKQATDVVSASQTAMRAARNALLDRQMLPRGIIGFLLVFLLVNLAAWHARPYFSSMLVGVAGYLVTFNVKFFLIDHKTYSMSSLVDATSFIGSTALTVLLSVLVGWIMVMIATNVYLLRPRKAADLTMKYILVLLSVFSIPVIVNYVVNGLVVTWTLPDFLTSFLGLSFLVQNLMAAIIGIIFTGFAALLGVFARRG